MCLAILFIDLDDREKKHKRKSSLFYHQSVGHFGSWEKNEVANDYFLLTEIFEVGWKAAASRDYFRAVSKKLAIFLFAIPLCTEILYSRKSGQIGFAVRKTVESDRSSTGLIRKIYICNYNIIFLTCLSGD